MTNKDESASAAKAAISAAKRPVMSTPPLAAKAISKAPAVASKKVSIKQSLKAKTKTPAAATANAKSVSKVVPSATTKVAIKSSAAKLDKIKKPKMVRDSFTFPKTEYEVLEVLKLRAAKLGNPVKKTELLRAGIKAIAAMQDTAFLAAVKVVPNLKTGRPAKAKPN